MTDHFALLCGLFLLGLAGASCSTRNPDSGDADAAARDADGLSCDAGITACGSTDGGFVCVNLLLDDQNCGTCGEVCAAIYQCLGGRCLCPPGLTSCGSACVDVLNEQANCGTCGHACGATQTCRSGVCACRTGEVVCPNGTCAALAAACT